jgi:uncharacterized iron-regulated membrane protein
MLTRSSKKKWLDWHSLVGFSIGLLLFLICWSGTFATVSNEIDWLLTDAMRTKKQHTSSQDLVSAYKLVKQQQPEVEISAVISPDFVYSNIQVIIQIPNKTHEIVFVDVKEMIIKESIPTLTVARYFRSFHMSFFGFLGIGKYLVCIFAIGLAISLISALKFYKNWWRQFFSQLNTKSRRAFIGGLHRLSGLWSLWFVAIITLTSLWYLFEASRSDFIDGRFSYVDVYSGAAQPLPKIDAKKDITDIGHLVGLALDAIPELDIGSISLNRGGYVFITGQTDSILVRDRASKVYINPHTEEIVYAQRAAELSPYWLWSNMADPLHFGNFYGWISKTIWVIFGLILCYLSLSGTWMYMKRIAMKKSIENYQTIKWSLIMTMVVMWVAVIFSAIMVYLSGPVVNGVRQLPAIPWPTASFIILWSMATIILLTIYANWLLKRLKRQVTTPSE